MSDHDPWDEWDEVFGDLDPDEDTDPELLTAAVDRAMTLEIGLAARCHVALDQMLHGTVATLTGSRMSPGAQTAKLIDRIENIIKKSPLPGRMTNEQALEALSAARAANKKRNRVLHDEWMAAFDDDGPRLERTRTDIPGDGISATRENLRAISSVSAQLSAVRYRVLGIWLFLLMSRGVPSSEIEHECRKPLALISGVRESHQRSSEPPPAPPKNPGPPPLRKEI